MEKEIEAKFFIRDKNEIRKKLTQLGLNLNKPEFLMQRKTFHSQTEGGWMRVRSEGDKITMTFKEITGSGINDVNEIEIVVNDFDKASAIINQTSFKETSYQENFREVWNNGEVEIVIDTWPNLQTYIEIEAKHEEIVRQYSEKLGFDFDREAYFGSVDILYKEVYGISKESFINIKRITADDEEFKRELELSKKILYDKTRILSNNN